MRVARTAAWYSGVLAGVMFGAGLLSLAAGNVVAALACALTVVAAIDRLNDRREIDRLRAERATGSKLALENAEFLRRISSETPDVQQVVMECWADTHADVPDEVRAGIESRRGHRVRRFGRCWCACHDGRRDLCTCR